MIDPIIEKYVGYIERDFKTFNTAVEQQHWQESFQTILNVCRWIQIIRLDIGTLAHLDATLRSKTFSALEGVMSKFATVMQSILQFNEKDRPWVIKAFRNIEERLPEAEVPSGRELDNREVVVPDDDVVVT